MVLTRLKLFTVMNLEAPLIEELKWTAFISLKFDLFGAISLAYAIDLFVFLASDDLQPGSSESDANLILKSKEEFEQIAPKIS